MVQTSWLSAVTKLKPSEDGIAVVKAEPPGGVSLPTQRAGTLSAGVVAAIGPGKRLASGETRPIHLKVGDTVVFDVAAGTGVDINGGEVIMLHETDVLEVRPT
ncbi:hypothetical protein V5P93_004020 [Actinokineospora auranticolor]|uniref:10 kDa chaperonin n=1 Tax=Actinokineospora auranticolor TaxID=155976 RepID=A0A2S6GCP8_9PSEU|nr:co-chaperone GroES [Actinokineospora auranticolor]PPK62764.1 chaperonin GroES [Actinokineospora auranticolor]